jgi:hypothetical protein
MDRTPATGSERDGEWIAGIGPHEQGQTAHDDTAVEAEPSHNRGTPGSHRVHIDVGSAVTGSAWFSWVGRCWLAMFESDERTVALAFAQVAKEPIRR